VVRLCRRRGGDAKAKQPACAGSKAGRRLAEALSVVAADMPAIGDALTFR